MQATQRITKDFQMATGDVFYGVIRTPIELPPGTSTYRCHGWINGVSGHDADFVKLLVSHRLVQNYDIAGRSIADVPVGSSVELRESQFGAYFIERVTKEESIEAPETPSYQPVQTDLRDFLGEEPARTKRVKVAADPAVKEKILHEISLAKRRIRYNENIVARKEQELEELGAL